ncbi:protein kinase domain-containing protein [Halotia branconii]|uniref:non-specific serine/threonine protein kinase n=1 Tax=Halotia branconii CENA392 TaxID=1539056 RepID=A0AAJ6PBG7_9CYAN|nr:serine/threonine-protein kinase [Halotia branconii]WGV27806.1 serine/threonine-protein kinase [Halotia branconii CENA392]
MLGQLLDGRYKILQTLGSGGFSHTYIAEDTKLYNTRCVVKQLKPQATDPKHLQLARRLFDSEAQLLHELGNHNQIPQLLAHFEENQEFYLVQQFIPGHPLSRELTPGKRWSEAYVIALLQSILEPLVFVHQNHVIHRDIKPPNLIRRQSDGQIVLIDFGAVKQIGTRVLSPQGQTRMTVCIGTPGYMPSEQSQGCPKLSSDIYAVGLICIQALTGLMPDHLKEDPQTAEIIWRDLVSVDPELGDVLDKMVRYDFRQRYQSAAEALARVQKLANTYALTSQSVTRTYTPILEHSHTQPPLFSVPPPVLPQYSREVAFPAKLLSPLKPFVIDHYLRVGWSFYFQWILASVFGYAGGFFIGFGLLGNLGEVASICFCGLAVGVKQWIVLRRKVSQPSWEWVLATTLAVVITFFLSGLTNLKDFIFLHGFIIGIGQWFVLRRLVYRAGWWILVNAIGGWIGGIISGVMLLWLLQRPKSTSNP